MIPGNQPSAENDTQLPQGVWRVPICLVGLDLKGKKGLCVAQSILIALNRFEDNADDLIGHSFGVFILCKVFSHAFPLQPFKGGNTDVNRSHPVCDTRHGRVQGHAQGQVGCL